MPQAISAAQMSEITNTLNLLILAVLGGAITMVGVAVAAAKWYLPKRLEQQTAEREARLDAFKTELANKAAADKVDIERDKMLPILVENMMQSNRSTIQMAESFHTTMMQSVQQTAAWNAQLKAHDGQLTANTDRLEELAQTVDTAITNIQLLTKTVEANTDHSKTAAVYGQQAAKTAQDTLELVKSKIIQAVAESKHDTGPLPPLAEIEKPAETNAGEGSAAA